MSEIHIITGCPSSGKTGILNVIASKDNSIEVIDLDDRLNWETIGEMLKSTSMEDISINLTNYIEQILTKTIESLSGTPSKIVISGEYTTQDIIASCTIPATDLQQDYSNVKQSCVNLPEGCNKHYIKLPINTIITNVLSDYIDPSDPEEGELNLESRFPETPNNAIENYLTSDALTRLRGGPWNEETWTIGKMISGPMSPVEWMLGMQEIVSEHESYYQSLDFKLNVFDDIVKLICK